MSKNVQFTLRACRERQESLPNSQVVENGAMCRVVENAAHGVVRPRRCLGHGLRLLRMSAPLCDLAFDPASTRSGERAMVAAKAKGVDLRAT